MQYPFHESLHGNQYISFHFTTVCPFGAPQLGSVLNNEEAMIAIKAIPIKKIIYFQAALIFILLVSLELYEVSGEERLTS